MENDDVDIFTQQIMDRTRKRRENLNKKMGQSEKNISLQGMNMQSRKRPSPLKEDTINIEDAEGKRYCENVPNKHHVGTEKFKDGNEHERFENSKENRSITLQSRLQRLAKLHSCEEIDSPPPKPLRLYPDISLLMNEESNALPDVKQSHQRKNKLAALAAVYNEIEEDTNMSKPPSSQNKDSKLPVKHAHFVNKTNHSSTVQTKNSLNVNPVAPVSNSTNSPSKKSAINSASFAEVLEKFQKPSHSGTKVSSAKVGITSVHQLSKTNQITPETNITPKGSPSSDSKSLLPERLNNSSTKKAIWDEAIIATLQKQGFVHSPSRSKLEYDFNKQNDANSKKETTTKKSLKINENNSASKIDGEKIPMPPPLPENSHFPPKIQQSPRCVSPEIKTSPQKKSNSRIKEISKQLNVQLQTDVKKKTDPAELPLSARVALFEQATQAESAAAAASRIVTGLAPHKISPAKQSAAPISHGKVGKVAGEIHRQLFKQTNENWTKNQINSKLIENRKKELNNLINREAFDDDDDDDDDDLSKRKKLSQKSSEKTEGIKNRVTCESDENLENSSSCEDYDDDLSNASEDEGLNHSSDNTNEIKNNSVCSEESDENVSDFLDEALDANVSSSDNDSSYLKPSVKPTRLSSDRCLVENREPKNLSQTSQHSICYPSVINSEEQILMHSVSFYRRQKQETRSTPVRTIVRQEVRSPPQNKIDHYSLIKEKIQSLQEEINAQQIIISQTSQALNLCRSTADFHGSAEQVEGERLLLIATHKRQACVTEVQRLKTEGALGNGPSFQDDKSTGTLSIKGIQLHLKKDFLHQTDNGKTGEFVHFFIGLLKYGSQVISTQMLSTMDVTHGALIFPNLINISELKNNFNILFEIYGLQTRREQVAVDRFRTLSKKDKSKLNLTPKKLLSKQDSKALPIQSPGGPSAVRTSSFALIGFTNINIKTLMRKIWVLEKVPFMSPLDGNMEMKIHCHSDFNVEERGFLTMFDDVSGFGAWHRRWCAVVGTTLAFWKYPDDEKRKEPIGFLDLRKCVTSNIGLVPRDICARPNTFMLVTVRPPKDDDSDNLVSQTYGTYTALKHLLSADTKEERIIWCNTLNSVLTTIRMWDPEALRPFDNTQTDSD